MVFFVKCISICILIFEHISGGIILLLILSFKGSIKNWYLYGQADCKGPPPSPVQQRRKGHEKCIFETPHNEMKCVMSMKE